MTDWGRVMRCAAAGAGAAALLAGCNSGGGTSSATSSSAAATSTMAQAAPTSVDGCQLPQSVKDAEHMDTSSGSADRDANGGITFKGCIWVTYDGDGYSANITSTNMTVQMVEKMSDYKVAEHLNIDGRQAVTYQTTDQAGSAADCDILSEIKGGGLNILIDNPPSNKATGTQDACGIAKRLAGELIPTLPATA